MAAIFVGEEPYSCDPAVSESSNRSRFFGTTYRKFNRKIAIAVSGVPSELKHLSRVRNINTIEIPLVAASESGEA